VSDSKEQDQFFAQFLDDYFAECAEHLALVRRHLLILEKHLGRSRVDLSILDELFRSFHTLKGISGMVGLAEAEQLAHCTEAYLRELRQETVLLTLPGFEALMTATVTLEQVIAARQKEEPIPDIEPVLRQLNTILVSVPVESDQPQLETSKQPEITHSLEATNQERTLPLWRFEFAPTAELANRGININHIRARLQEIGEVKQAIPRVIENGGIAFEFVVATSANESLFADWTKDNLTFGKIEIEEHAPQTGLAPSETLDQLVDPESTADAFSPESESTVRPQTNVVRVDLARLDELMRIIGELVISRARIEDHLKQVKRDLPPSEWRAFQETNLAMSRQIRDLREAVMHVRMVQVGEIFERMQFVVRDLARESGKQIRIESFGKGTEIDKFLVERMTDPLLHLVRNAVSHGLETVDERLAAGKTAEGTITLRAASIGDNVMIEITDDGRGVDVDAVIQRALSRGLIGANDPVEQVDVLDLICTPGFSTREEADRTSGRGVGMDVVKRAIQELGGSISLTTERNTGTQFTIELPLTLAIADALVATVGNTRFAIPQSAITEVIEVETSAVRVFENNEIVSYREGVLPLVRLSRLFNLESQQSSVLHVFVIGKGTNAMGLAVDRIIGQREVVVRSINDPLVRVEGIAGATDLGDARVVLILDVPALRRLATGDQLPA
jgi:two-component system, chemotaxis family, sensor kinase CheA